MKKDDALKDQFAMHSPLTLRDVMTIDDCADTSLVGNPDALDHMLEMLARLNYVYAEEMMRARAE